MRSRFGKLVVLSFIGLFLSLSVSAPVLAADDTIKLGVAGPHSGDLASYGIPTIKAAELVVKDINAKGGVLGKKVELVVEDDVCQPQVSTNVAKNTPLGVNIFNNEFSCLDSGNTVRCQIATVGTGNT